MKNLINQIKETGFTTIAFWTAIISMPTTALVSTLIMMF